MDKMACYSLFQQNFKRRTDLIRQLVRSIRSLRAHNQFLPITVFAYGNLSELHQLLKPYNVLVQDQGSYEHRLANWMPDISHILCEYPVLHKLLNFPEIDAQGVSRVLLLDCDTVFFDDVDDLFAKYGEADCYAREEPGCRRSPNGYNPAYLDEDRIARLASLEEVRIPPPFNTGVLLLNHRVWQRLPLQSVLLSYVWRFLIWMALNPVDGVGIKYREGMGANLLRHQFRDLVTSEMLDQALCYPSANRWILDEVSLWFTLGHAGNLLYADFAAKDVLQNGEFVSRNLRYCDWILCHYFSNNGTYFDQWIRQCANEGGVPTRLWYLECDMESPEFSE
jgi:hypothetical protein